MKTKRLLIASFLLAAAVFANATPTLVTGTPGWAGSSPATPPSPIIGTTLINFDNLTPYTTYASSVTLHGVTFSSPDGLAVLPFSTQSGPNYLYDTSSDGSANLSITTSFGTKGIGVGIADSDGIPVTLEALGINGTDLGTFQVSLPTDGYNAFNGYYVIEDSTADIYGITITQGGGGGGLAIDDVQVAPEPASLSMLFAGIAGLGAFRFRKRA